jgi:hypothetical protein
MYVHEHFLKARHEDMLRAAAKDRLAAQVLLEPAAHRLAHLPLPPRRLLAMVRTRRLRTAR